MIYDVDDEDLDNGYNMYIDGKKAKITEPIYKELIN